MRSFVQPGSHTTSTLASVTPGTALTFAATSTGSDCAAGQPGRGQRHRDDGDARGVDRDVVNQPELPDVDRDLRVEHGRDRLTIAGRNASVLSGSAATGVGGVGSGVGTASGGIMGRGFMSCFRATRSTRSARGRAPPSSCATRGSRTSRAWETRARRRAPTACRDPRPAGPGGDVTMRVKPLEQPRASATVLPLSASVISDADAFEIAQPDPWNATSVIASPSSCTYRVSRSPQSGL